jgi:mRNA interferase MazF
MYVPDRGDVVWLSFDPQVGREQAGHRPAVVLSPKHYNGKVGLVICCPVTSQIKGYPFEVPIPDGVVGVTGVVLADHVSSLDWQGRQAKFITRLPDGGIEQILEKLSTLLR